MKRDAYDYITKTRSTRLPELAIIPLAQADR
jgi:hypothetical protein